VECYIGQVIEPTFGDKLTRVNNFFIVILKNKIIRLFIISTSVVGAKRAGFSLFNVIFVLKAKKGDNSTTNRVLNIHGFHVITLNQ
jgi:sugar phosphate permease